MRKNLIILNALLLFIFIFPGCEKQKEQCLYYNNSQVTQVTGPATATVNQEVAFNIKFLIGNGCGRFENIEAAANGYTVTIDIVSKYSGCICTQNLVGGETTYTFKPAQTGVYELRFMQPDKTFFSHTITVN